MPNTCKFLCTSRLNIESEKLYAFFLLQMRKINTSILWLKTFTCLKGASQVKITAARSRQDSWASSAKKIRPLEKKLGRKPATPQFIRKSAVKNFCYKFLGQFLPIIVKIRPQLGNLELGRFLGRGLPRPQEILLGHFWVQRPWIRPSGTSAKIFKLDFLVSIWCQPIYFSP